MAKSKQTDLRIPDPSTKPKTSNAWQETVDRFPNDRQIRSNGYEIASRPNVGETIWRNVESKKLIGQIELLRILNKEGKK